MSDRFRYRKDWECSKLGNLGSAGVSVGASQRTIVQTGRDWRHALTTKVEFMRPWWRLNPEYDYVFYNDSRATAFVNEHASTLEWRAFRSIRNGASRSDLFRLFYLRSLGGVYADLDLQPSRRIDSMLNGRDPLPIPFRSCTSARPRLRSKHPRDC